MSDIIIYLSIIEPDLSTKIIKRPGVAELHCLSFFAIIKKNHIANLFPEVALVIKVFMNWRGTIVFSPE